MNGLIGILLNTVIILCVVNRILTGSVPVLLVRAENHVTYKFSTSTSWTHHYVAPKGIYFEKLPIESIEVSMRVLAMIKQLGYMVDKYLHLNRTPHPNW